LRQVLFSIAQKMAFYVLMSSFSDIQSIYKPYNDSVAHYEYIEDKNHRFLHELNKRLL